VVEIQRTIARAAGIEGAGLHTGASSSVRILPAGADTGVLFVLPGRGGLEIPAVRRFLKRGSLATTLARDGTEVQTVEHLLSALLGLGIDNARIELHGPEVPILDGSSRPFVDLIRSAGVRSLGAPRRYLTLTRPIAVRRGDKEIVAVPANELQITYAIDFPHPAIGYQTAAARLSEDTYAASIAPARTFCLLRDVDTMRRAGLALGGSLDNALVVGERGVMNGSLRFPDEFVRHKILDLLGDLALLGSPLRAHVIACKGGHQLHAALIDRILASRAAWSLATSEQVLPASRLERFAHLTERLIPRHAPPTA
jgi:UDP-3-O-[3-hydroxymyristoyl] N-acetylglucosamine deacetylase